MKIKNKIYIIRIPDKIHVFYCKKKKIIIIKGPINQKFFKIETKIKIKTNTIEILFSPKSSNSLQKNLKSNQGTAAALIKQLIIEASTIFYKKLNFIGIGYRALFIENNVLLLNLGFSHPIYFNIPINFKIFCLKLIKLFISGNSYQNLSDITTIIRYKKLPEPYKGKGILHGNEKIKIKESKKI